MGGSKTDARAHHVHETGGFRPARLEPCQTFSGRTGMENFDDTAHAAAGEERGHTSHSAEGTVSAETDLSGVRLASLVEGSLWQ